MKAEQLIKAINKAIPEAEAVPSEEFNNEVGGIWIKGSEDYMADNSRIFNCYGYEETNGIAPKLNDILENAGWHGEAYDAGTLMAYK